MPDNDACALIHTAPLNSPKPAVVSTLQKGDVLPVELDQSGTRAVLKVITAGGLAAGSLTHREHGLIIQCIEAGHHYRATVIEKVGGSVTVRIERR